MILSIKLQDKVFVTTSNKQVRWSPNYDVARGSIESIFKIDPSNSKKFDFIISKVFEHFSTSDAYNLYYLADAILVVENLINSPKNNYSTLNVNIEINNTPVNFLNFFGFEIDEFPNNKQLKILRELKKNNLIEYYWIEEEFQKISSASTKIDSDYKPIQNDPKNEIKTGFDFSMPLDLFTEQDYIKELQINNVQNRGKGSSIIDFEYIASDNLDVLKRTTYLKKLTNVNFVGSVGEISQTTILKELQHQVNTLTILFADTPIEERNKIPGLVPEAKFAIFSLTNQIEKLNKSIPLQEETSKIRINNLVRKYLAEMGNEYRNSILLLEFEMQFFLSKSLSKTLPIVVCKDIVDVLNKNKDKNIIAITAAGNQDINFDTFYEREITSRRRYKDFNYIDLKTPNPGFIMIGATTKNRSGKYIIDKDRSKKCNFGGGIEAYFYDSIDLRPQNFINQTGKLFEGTSPAAAIAAGIVTYLQGKALEQSQGAKPISVDFVKKLFKNTFMKNFPLEALSPISLENLWKECISQLRNSQRQ